MTPIIEAVKRKVESMSCPIHHKNPIVHESGDEINIEVDCCVNFTEKCEAAMNEVLNESALSQLQGLFKKRR